MTKLNLIAAGAGALALGLALATSASAASKDAYRVSPPASNPHDVFRTVFKGPRGPEAAAKMQMARCDCPMMTGDAAARGQCMGMTGDHRDGGAESGKRG